MSSDSIQKAKNRSIANQSTTEWNVASTTGTFQGQHWPSHLPKPPSQKNLMMSNKNSNSGNATTSSNSNNASSSNNPNAPTVIVFNANTQEGSSMVRVLSEKQMNVIAVVRVFTSKTTKNLIKYDNVTVKVADLNNHDAVVAAAQGCQSAFLVTKYWERFESPIEESMAKNVLSAAATAGIQRLIFATFEDTNELLSRNRKSQLLPTVDGRIFPQFDGMIAVQQLGKQLNVTITNMFTSYIDIPNVCKKSIVLIRGENGKILCQPHIRVCLKDAFVSPPKWTSSST